MNSRKQISLEQKIKIIEDIDSGMRQSEIVKKYDLKQSTVATIVKKRKQIEESSFSMGPDRKRMRLTVNENLNNAVFKWFNEKRAMNIPINGPLICAKALHFSQLMNIEGFKASNGWLQKFRDRYGIVFS